MKIKIISDGIASNTHVVNMDTGEPISGVTKIEWGIYGPGQISECTLTLHNIPVEIEAGNIKSYKLSNKK